MGVQLFTNFAAGALASGISASATSASLVSGQGALFPAITPGSGDWFIVELVTNGDAASSASEIVQVTGRSTDTLTIIRAQEGTTASAWNAGDTVTLVNTAGTMANLAQPVTVQVQAGNYAIDSGTANVYQVTLTPVLTANVPGMPIRVFAGHTSTGNCTLNAGPGAAPLVYPDGTQLDPGEITGGAIFEAAWATTDGGQYQLIGASKAYAAAQASAAQSTAETFASALLAGTLGAAGSIALAIQGYSSPMILKWGFHSPGTSAGAGLETITFPAAFPHNCFFACAFSNRSSPGSVGTGAVLESSLSTTQFQATLDQDASGNRSGLWFAIGD